jgi:electron-transferring-flavoprotein dehydrogenase
MILNCKQLVIAEGCRGSLAEKIIAQYELRRDKQPQTYAIGIKEVWRINKAKHQAGHVMHTIGWPLDSRTYGGSFIYHWSEDLLSVGFVIGLDYKNPYLSPFDEMQRFKTHPKLKYLFEDGERISYGARALNEGGLQSLPQLDFPGGVIVGCSAGFLNVPKIKGSHLAMKSGMVAAEAIHRQLSGEETPVNYDDSIRTTWAWKELKQVRNIRPAFNKGLWFGMAYAAIDTYLLFGKAPWTFKHHHDHLCLEHKDQYTPINYPKADGQVTFDKISSVFLANTFHEESQPCHLILKEPQQAVEINLAKFDSPETRYCPAGVYEIVEENSTPRLQINFQNCIHCKTCDIKDPTQNITWTTPEGGGGPNYAEM